MNEQITMVCSECKEKNYITLKNKKNTTGKLELKKYCKKERKHTIHKEAK
jgi:large subunit ribosomal protein L33